MAYFSAPRPAQPPVPARPPRWLDAAFALSVLILYLVWLTRGDLTRGLPGGQATALTIGAVLVGVLGLARLALTGALSRFVEAIRAAPLPALLAGLLLLAALPRVALPLGVTPDASIAARERAALAESHRILTTGDYRPETFASPSALVYLQTAAGSAAFLAGVSEDRWRKVSAVRPADLAAPARLLNAALSLLAVALVFVAGNALYNRRAGLIAAILLAFSPLAWSAARLATEDALVALVGLAAFSYCGLGIADYGMARAGAGKPGVASRFNPQPANLNPHPIVATLLVGFATGVRPSLALLVIPLGLALWWGRAWPGLAWLGLLPVAFGIGFLLAVPYAIAALPALLDAAAVAAREYELRLAPATLGVLARQLPGALALLARADPLLALAGGLGVLWALLARRRADFLLLSFLIPTALLLLLHRNLHAWHFAAYSPFLALLGGRFLADVGAVAQARRRPPAP